MGPSLSPSSPFLSTNSHLSALCPSHLFSFSVSSTPFLNFRLSRQPTVSLSVSVVDKKVNLSWLNPDRNSSDAYGGWGTVESQPEEEKSKKKGFLSLFLMGAGVSTLIFVSAIAYRSLGTKGFKWKFDTPWSALQRLAKPYDSIANQSENANVVDTEQATVSSDEKFGGDVSASVEKPPKRVIITISADSTQVEALQLLKKLEIIDDDVKAGALCTRREYARWLVKSNLAFERNPRHRMSILSSASVVQAFDDVNNEDPDFQFIQALAETGIIPSKLSNESASTDLNGFEIKGVNFYPESYISRMDLINWKAQLEYSRVPQVQQILTKDIGFMDVSTIIPEVSLEFIMDMMAGDKSILRRVFGQSRRFQPHKPATTAQAAVALTSGRMTEAIRTELLRWEAENSSILAEMDEIRSEFLLRGDIQKFWEEKINEVKVYGQEVARHFDVAINDLEQEKSLREKSLNENLKEMAALECQRKLLVNLKGEVDELSERLASERVNFAAEQKSLRDMSIDLQAKQDATTEAKSILEAEKEALRMLRSWIEDEARRSKARAQVLEQVGRRWKWKEEA